MNQSISIEKAAAELNIPLDFLTMLCNQDEHQKIHHKTVYSKQIRFTPDEIQRAKRKLTNGKK